MVLQNAEQQQRHAVVSFQGVDWIEEMERTKRGQAKRQQQKQARLAAKYYKSKRKQAKNAASAAAAAAPDMMMLPFQNFLEFLSSPPLCNTKDNDDTIRQGILDLPLCSATLNTFASSHEDISNASGAMIIAETCTQEDKMNMIHKLKNNVMNKETAPLDIVVYYGGLVWMTQAKSHGLYDFDAKPATILPNSSAGGNAAGDGIINDNDENNDKVIRHSHQHGVAVPETRQKDATSTSVDGKTLIETVSDENVMSKVQQFTDNENHKNNCLADSKMDVKNTHQSSRHENDNWLVCCAESY